ncbi:hypothetical protein BJ138DRAFT_1123580 [Hygrophoropsis aurantiaca]|uniref:Uncharacterized protein n=1 Tax=Hygrophoropsis aurantiaca TaxID=72124 RepID=A0ACB8ALM0_9AGAM|nr:hypothetical protein BJ138DRAFT_1123580 [Hygrophoropsis aurantiaca]
MPGIRAGGKSTFFSITLVSILLSLTLLVESAEIHGWTALTRHRRAMPAGNPGLSQGLSGILNPASGSYIPSSIPSTSSLGGVTSSLTSLSIPQTATSSSAPAAASQPSKSPPQSSPVTSSASTRSAAQSTSSVIRVATTSSTSSSALGSSASTSSAVSSSAPAGAVAQASIPAQDSGGEASSGAPIASAGNSDNGIPSMTPITSTPSSSSTPTSTGFFSNKGAVAGTFTVVGLVGIAGIIGVGMLIVRRRSKGDYDGDTEYLENHREPEMRDIRSRTPDAGSIDMDHGFSDIQSPPVTHTMYPDYAAHPNPGNDTSLDVDPSYYNQDTAHYSPRAYGIDYPPGQFYAEPQQPAEAYIPYQPAQAYGAQGRQAAGYGGMPNPHDQSQYLSPTSPTAAASVPLALRPTIKRQVSNPFLQTSEQGDQHPAVDSFYGGLNQDHTETTAY